MEIGNQIKALRTARGITQEALAEKLNVSAQAVSKWERGATVPDVLMLPELSAYFGVTIDELFALSDETRMERIQNMIWNERELDHAVVEREELFLLEKARKEPENGKPLELLADLENKVARGHRSRAEGYAKAALERDPWDWNAHRDLVQAMGGRYADWCVASHHQLIDWYKGFLREHPDNWHGYLLLIDQLLDDQRFGEAEEYCARLARINSTYRVPLYQGLVAWYAGRRQEAMETWEQMCRDFPEEWAVWFQMGDVMARSGQWERAKDYYRKGMELQAPPRFTDALESIAAICEQTGDCAGAIAALEEEVALLASDWHITSGETVDAVRREIARLREKQGD